MPIRFSLRAANGQEYPITGPFRIGREPECQVQIDNNLVSRIHASIWIDHEHLMLRDERSRNGTQLNGQTLAPGEAHYLHHDDQVRVGDTVFIVVRDPPYPRQHRGLADAPEDEPPRTAQVDKPGPAPAPRSMTLPLAIGGCLLLVILVACCLLGFVLVARVRPNLNPLNPAPAPVSAELSSPTSAGWIVGAETLYFRAPYTHVYRA